MERLTLNLASGVRRETLRGRSYLVALLTSIVPGVLPGSKGPLLYREKHIANSVPKWDGIPITVYHPVSPMGDHLSAKDKGVLDRQGVGHLRNSRFDGKLRHEAWIDEERVKAVDPRVHATLLRGEPMEVSTGLYTTNVEGSGTHNGRGYTHEAVDYRPDHMALLPDQVGACSNQDGCGLLVNAWSQEARDASLAARQASKTAREKSDATRGIKGAVDSARAAHIGATMASMYGPQDGKESEAANLHKQAAADHDMAAARHSVKSVSIRGDNLVAHKEAAAAHREAAVIHRDAESEYRDRMPTTNRKSIWNKLGSLLGVFNEKGPPASGSADAVAAAGAQRRKLATNKHHCPRCGEEMDDDDEECPECGAVQNADTRADVVEEPEDDLGGEPDDHDNPRGVSRRKPPAANVGRDAAGMFADDDGSGDDPETGYRSKSKKTKITGVDAQGNPITNEETMVTVNKEFTSDEERKAAFAHMADAGSASGKALKATHKANASKLSRDHSKAAKAHNDARAEAVSKGQSVLAEHHDKAMSEHYSKAAGKHPNSKVNNRCRLVDSIIANGYADPTDRPLLEAMSEQGLLTLNAKAEGSNADTSGGDGSNQAGGEEDDDDDDEDPGGGGSDKGKGLKNTPEKAKDATTNEREWFASAPPRVQAVVRNAMELEDRERSTLIARLTANAGGDAKKRLVAKFKTMDVRDLRDMVGIVGNAGHRGNPFDESYTPPALFVPGGPSEVTVNAVNPDDVLIPPTLNWKEIAEENRAKRA